MGRATASRHLKTERSLVDVCSGLINLSVRSASGGLRSAPSLQDLSMRLRALSTLHPSWHSPRSLS